MATQNETQATSTTIQNVMNDPDVRQLVTSKLDEQIANTKAQLQELENQRAQFAGDASAETPAVETPAAPKKRGRPVGSGKKDKAAKTPSNGKRGPGRPSGVAPDHAGSILKTLSGTKGLSAAEIVQKLIAQNKPEDPAAYGKTLRTYLSKMSNESDGRLVTSGERGSLVYKAARKASKK